MDVAVEKSAERISDSRKLARISSSSQSLSIFPSVLCSWDDDEGEEELPLDMEISGLPTANNLQFRKITKDDVEILD